MMQVMMQNGEFLTYAWYAPDSPSKFDAKITF